MTIKSIPDYVEALEDELQIQQVKADATRWAVASGRLNRELHQMMQNRKRLALTEEDRNHEQAMHAFACRLWQEYNALVRGDDLDPEWEQCVAECKSVLSGAIAVSEVKGLFHDRCFTVGGGGPKISGRGT